MIPIIKHQRNKRYFGFVINWLSKITVRYWIVLGIANLLLVAASGLLMRLKFLVPLPAVNQKYLLHAHSHFAFSGWVSHTLMVLIIAAVCSTKAHEKLPLKYQTLLIANLLASYAMLVSFFLQGYGLYAICAASLSVAISYIFAVLCWRNMRQPAFRAPAYHWFRASLVLLVLSSLGTFFLAYLMASRNTDTRIQLAAVYFFLHFQYNGWFFFSCMGLMQHWLERRGVTIRHARFVFWAFTLACAPAYLLSVLWWDMPGWLYAVAVGAVTLQGVAWGAWLRALGTKLALYKHRLPAVAKGLLIGAVIAATIKILLQGLSVIPSLSQLVYSFRPVVIGYLHLVLLAIITFFMLAYAYMKGALSTNRPATISTGVFAAGVVLNELLLALQGISGLAGFFIAQFPLLLAVAAGIIVFGIGSLLWSQRGCLTSTNPQKI